MTEEDIAALGELPGWTVVGPVATFTLGTRSWTANIRRVTVVGNGPANWLCSIIDPTGVTRHTTSSNQLGYARHVAEIQVITHAG